VPVVTSPRRGSRVKWSATAWHHSRMGLEYCNPVHDGYFADPFVMRTDDGYVAIGTGRSLDGMVFEVLRSDDLVHWRSVGGALVPPPGLGTDFWAPEVAHADGRWWMYYSVGTGDAGHHLRVAVADEPTGPYHDLEVNLTPDERFAIDPHPFQDRDGTWWLYFARDVLEGDRVGTMLAVRRLEGMSTLTGPTVAVLEASADWQIYQRDRPMYGAVYDWHTLEGPFVREHDGRYYLFYSGGSWLEPTYGVAYAVADRPEGPWVEPTDSEPLLRTVPGTVVGPGHNSVVTTPEGLDVMAYHAWDPAQTRRRLCIDPIAWSHGRPSVLGPTFEPVSLPR
jgi:arabinan endo-1,5-alpha-L-arabinosidase